MALAAGVIGFAAPALAQQQAPPAQQPAPASKPAEQHVRGDVVAVTGNTVEVKTRSGERTRFTLAEKTRVSVATKADREKIATNGYVGTTAVPQPDGTLRAIEVHLFPEAARGAGEGHRPWDLGPGSAMTNATVQGLGSSAGGGQSTMTNATVADVAKGGEDLKLSLRYPGGEQTVVVPSGTPVVQLEAADRSRITPGAHVFAAVIAQGGGAPVADRIVVGKDVVPPM
jgi:hypothetical protein